ncbi:MAG: NAD(P)/FAD-dependent oxidoreductase [Spirochaetaceae bacterium]|nr:NAD(P)/FAD-dependent oxidoreductase [Spirochaetaceae bacterium]
MGKRVLVIGAGIAGLSAAGYLQRNGFDTEIFELHDKAGGLCTSWTRDGYSFDGCVHWLMGSGPASNLHELWKELGAADLRYVEWDVYTSARLSDGDTFNLYTDPDRLEAEILRLGPADGAVARLVAANVRRTSRLDMPAALDKLKPGAALALAARLPSALLLAPWIKKSVADLVRPVKSARLREGFERLFGDAMDELPAAALFMMLGFMAKKSSGYPIGGSLAFARALEADYLSRGGKIRYKSRVDEILVEGGRAVGLRGAWGSETADYVVSAADGYDTVKRLLGGRYPHPDLEASFADQGGPGAMKRYPSLIYLSLGLAADFSAQPHSQVFTLDEPLALEGGALGVKRFPLRLYHFDPTSAPAGKTAATVMVETGNDAYWTGLKAKDPAAYAAEKAETARKLIGALDRFVPGLAAAVETVDLATPATFIRYTNNWRGSYEGWLPTGGAMGKKIARTLPGLANFHMVGQWTNAGGGLPPCAIEGRRLAKRLCKAEGRRFRPD